jgi:hypothetical protein
LDSVAPTLPLLLKNSFNEQRGNKVKDKYIFG